MYSGAANRYPDYAAQIQQAQSCVSNPFAARSATALLGPPPLLDGEDAAARDALYERVRAAVAPRDALKKSGSGDVVDNLWERPRLRRLKTQFVPARAPDGLMWRLRLLTGRCSNDEEVTGCIADARALRRLRPGVALWSRLGPA